MSDWGEYLSAVDVYIEQENQMDRIEDAKANDIASGYAKEVKELRSALKETKEKLSSLWFGLVVWSFCLIGIGAISCIHYEHTESKVQAVERRIEMMQEYVNALQSSVETDRAYVDANKEQIKTHNREIEILIAGEKCLFDRDNGLNCLK
jgi:peptidoglycan hydrolase CwlO-like protein